MKKNPSKTTRNSSLRKQAELLLKTRMDRLEELSGQDIKALIHELGTHQIELEMQNEQLRAAHDELESSRRKYADLYEFAPVGCMTLDQNGTVLELNTMAAFMLGYDRHLLLNKIFTNILAGKEEKAAFSGHLAEVLRTRTKGCCEIRLMRGTGPALCILMETIVADEGPDKKVYFLTALLDITTRKQAEDKLAHMASFPKLNPNPVLELDPLGAIVYYNPAAEKLMEELGLEKGEMAKFLPTDMYDLLSSWNRRKTLNRQSEVSLKGRTYAVTVYFNPQFRTVRVYAFDISQRKHAEEELSRSEERFRRIAEQSNEIIFLMDIEGRFTYCSPAIAQYGYEPDRVIGRSYSEFVLPQTLDYVAAALDRVRKGENVNLFEIDVKKADGSVFTCEVSATPVRTGSAVTGIQGMARDISERKRAAERLFVAQQRLQAVMQAVPVGISFSDDRSCTNITGNPALLEQFEMTEGDNVSASAESAAAAGRKVRYFRAGRELRDIDLPLQRAVNEGRVIHSEELRVEMPSGREWTTEVSGAPILDSDGNVVGGVAVTIDITERKRAEEREQQQLRETLFANRVLRTFVEYEGNEIFDQSLAIVLEQMASRHGVFGYISQPGHLICPSLSKMLDVCEVEGKCIHYPPEKWKGLWAQALTEKRSLYTNIAPPVPNGHPIIHNNLATPILFQGEVIGLLNIANKDGGYTDDDRDRLDRFVVRVAPVLYAWIQRKLREDERKQADKSLRQHADELERFNRAAVDRELRMIELKKEVNRFLIEAGREPRYPIGFENG